MMSAQAVAEVKVLALILKDQAEMRVIMVTLIMLTTQDRVVLVVLLVIPLEAMESQDV